MSLSKQLYLIISIIFCLIFVGNFLISVKNTKEYLEVESISKAQDTATTLGFNLKNLISNKSNPEIETTINAVSNSGFYKEIRLEDALFTIKESDVKKASKDLKDGIWEISNLKVDPNIGAIETLTQSDDFMQELITLNGSNPNEENKNITPSEDIYTFVPNKNISGKIELNISFTAKNQEDKEINTSATLELNKILVQVDRDVKFDSVPQWFINLIPINLPEQSSEISDGWKTSAILFVSANAGEAYNKLFAQVKSAIIYAIIMFILSMIIIFLFVQYLLKPLKSLENSALSIADGNFVQVKPTTKTTEIVALSNAFNGMSRKIEATINRLNLNIENMSKKLSTDDLTGLAIKQTFETDMKQLFINKSNAYILLIKISDLGLFAKSNTSNDVNNFIKEFADILKTTKLNEDTKIEAYRFFGSEFAVIATHFTKENLENYAKILKSKFEELGIKYDKSDIAHIGASIFNQFSTTDQILQSANQAYEKATIIGPNEISISLEDELIKDMDSWREFVINTIEDNNFTVNYTGNFTRCNSDEIIMQEAFTSIKDKENNNIPIGTFVSIAEKYEKIIDFDKKVIEKVIEYILINDINYDIAINLSLDSINNTAFIAWLEKKLEDNKNIVSKLVFSATAYAAAKDIEKFKFFASEIKSLGAKIIIKRYETRFISLNDIKELKLDYLRLAREYTNDICIDFSKQSFIESIAEISNLINIKVLAENVQKDEDFNYIKDINLFAASR